MPAPVLLGASAIWALLTLPAEGGELDGPTNSKLYAASRMLSLACAAAAPAFQLPGHIGCACVRAGGLPH